MKVRYIKKGEYQGSEMTVGKEYEVLGIEADYYRIIDNSKNPFLYNPTQFVITDSTKPDFWISEFEEDEEQYCYPKEWAALGFFEDYHDRKQEAVSKFWSDCKRLYDINKSA